LRIGVLAAFERQRVAAGGAHVFGGADAVAQHGLQFAAAAHAALHAGAVGAQPAFDEAAHAETARQRALLLFVLERLQRPSLLRGPTMTNGSPPAEGMQVEQHIMLRPAEGTASWPRGPQILRMRIREQIAIQIALASAFAFGVGQRIGDRHERHRATPDQQRAAIQFLQHALNGLGAAGFVAMHGAGDDELDARMLAAILDGFELHAESD
jgi:hypothetical protein